MVQEQPLYSISMQKTPFLVVKLATLFVLSAIFYLGIYLNLLLLDLRSSQVETILIYAALFVILLLLIGILINLKKASTTIRFFARHLQVGKKKVKYLEMYSVKRTRNWFDKQFRTYTIKINRNIKLEAIDDGIDLKTYIEQLIAYNKGQTQQQQAQEHQAQQLY